jgi:hypothetical protein
LISEVVHFLLSQSRTRIRRVAKGRVCRRRRFIVVQKDSRIGVVVNGQGIGIDNGPGR